MRMNERAAPVRPLMPVMVPLLLAMETASLPAVTPSRHMQQRHIHCCCLRSLPPLQY